MKNIVNGASMKHIVAYISKRTGLSKSVVQQVMGVLPDAIKLLVAEYGMVRLFRIGTFRIRCRRTWRTPSGFETKLEMTPTTELLRVGAMAGANESPELLEIVRRREAHRLAAAARNSRRWREKDKVAEQKRKQSVKEWVQQVLKDLAGLELAPEAIPDIPDPPRPPKVVIDPVTGEEKLIPHWKDRAEEYHRKLEAGEVVPDRSFP